MFSNIQITNLSTTQATITWDGPSDARIKFGLVSGTYPSYSDAANNHADMGGFVPHATYYFILTSGSDESSEQSFTLL